MTGRPDHLVLRGPQPIDEAQVRAADSELAERTASTSRSGMPVRPGRSISTGWGVSGGIDLPEGRVSRRRCCSRRPAGSSSGGCGSAIGCPVPRGGGRPHRLCGASRPPPQGRCRRNAEPWPEPAPRCRGGASPGPTPRTRSAQSTTRFAGSSPRSWRVCGAAWKRDVEDGAEGPVQGAGAEPPRIRSNRTGDVGRAVRLTARVDGEGSDHDRDP